MASRRYAAYKENPELFCATQRLFKTSIFIFVNFTFHKNIVVYVLHSHLNTNDEIFSQRNEDVLYHQSIRFLMTVDITPISC